MPITINKKKKKKFNCIRTEPVNLLMCVCVLKKIIDLKLIYALIYLVLLCINFYYLIFYYV